MAEDGNISSFQRAKWSELGDHLDPDFRKQDTIPRFGHETGQDRRIAAYMVCGAKLLKYICMIISQENLISYT
jgi:hypothetical protein